MTKRWIPKERIPLLIYVLFCSGALVGLWFLHGILDKDTTTKQKTGIQLIKNGLPEKDWYVTAFSDFKRSGSLDILYTDKQKKELKIYTFNNYNKSYDGNTIYKSANPMASVFPYDLYFSGYNDLIVSMNNSGLYDLYVLKNEEGIFGNELTDLKIKSETIPFPFNIFMDSHSELLITSPNTNKTQRVDKNGKITETNLPKYDSFVAGQLCTNCPISILGKRGHAVDVITGFEVTNTFLIPNASSSLELADFDQDGQLDLVFTFNSSVCIMFNTADGFTSDETCSNENSMRIHVNGLLHNGLQIGDLNLNGRPDIAVTTNMKSKRNTAILLNQLCSNCGSHETIFAEFPSIPGEGGFFDLDGDGRLDIVTDCGSFGSNFTSKEMFITVTPLNGVCLEHCKTGPRNPNPQPLATTAIGATIRLVYTDKRGHKHKAVGVGRSSNRLELPSWTFGLSNDVHYIEEVIVASAETDTWTWVLPNSRVFASSSHKIRVFLGYRPRFFFVLFACIALLFVLGFFVTKLAIDENIEDKQEAAKILPMF